MRKRHKYRSSSKDRTIALLHKEELWFAICIVAIATIISFTEMREFRETVIAVLIAFREAFKA